MEVKDMIPVSAGLTAEWCGAARVTSFSVRAEGQAVFAPGRWRVHVFDERGTVIAVSPYMVIDAVLIRRGIAFTLDPSLTWAAARTGTVGFERESSGT